MIYTATAELLESNCPLLLAQYLRINRRFWQIRSSQISCQSEPSFAVDGLVIPDFFMRNWRVERFRPSREKPYRD
jgi:hypothetical protein